MNPQTITDWTGNIIGFRCSRCGEVYRSMWGNVCNYCRHSDEENAKLREEIKQLRLSLGASNQGKE